MKLLGVGVVCVALGFAVGWFLAPGPYRYVFRNKIELVLVNAAGERLGILPAATPMVSTEALRPHEKLGWWACVPVYLGTMKEAAALVEVTPERATPLSALLRINALRPSDVADRTAPAAPEKQ